MNDPDEGNGTRQLQVAFHDEDRLPEHSQAAQKTSQWSVGVSETMRHAQRSRTRQRLLVSETLTAGITGRFRQWYLHCQRDRAQEESRHRQHEPPRLIPMACSDFAFLGG